MQYVLFNADLVIGSLFVTNSLPKYTQILPRKVVVGKTNSNYKPVYGVEASGVLAYRGSEGGLLLIPTELPDETFFLIRDTFNL